MPKKSSRRKQREAKRNAKLKRRAHPDFIDGGRLKGYRRFCVFVRIWWVADPLGFLSIVVAAGMFESMSQSLFAIFILLFTLFTMSPLIVHIVRRQCFEEKLACPHCDLPSPSRWHDKYGDERLSDIWPRRRYYRELKKATDTYTCPYCGKTIYILPHTEYKKICGKVRKNRD